MEHPCAGADGGGDGEIGGDGMKCEKCGKEIGHLLVDTFLHDGTDTDIEQPIV